MPTVFGYWVRDPERYGVAEFDAGGRVIGLEEKPVTPKSNYAVTGLYFYDGRAPDFAAALKPSPRGELEITDLNRSYLEDGSLRLEKLGRGHAWLDTGTHESLLRRQLIRPSSTPGLRICCRKRSLLQRWIDSDQLAALARPRPRRLRPVPAVAAAARARNVKLVETPFPAA